MENRQNKMFKKDIKNYPCGWKFKAHRNEIVHLRGEFLQMVSIYYLVNRLHLNWAQTM